MQTLQLMNVCRNAHQTTSPTKMIELVLLFALQLIYIGRIQQERVWVVVIELRILMLTI